MIDDCGAQGQTVSFQPDGLFVTIDGVRNKIAKIEVVRESEPGTVDLVYRAVDTSNGEVNRYGKRQGMRFDSSIQGRLKLVAGSKNGVIYDKITDGRTLNSFDLKACPDPID